VVAREIDEQTHLGEVYMRSLMRSQLRLAVVALTIVGLFIAGLPLAFHVAPSFAEARVVGISVPWLLLGFAVYPIFVLIGWIYVRHAEHNEARFAELAAEPADEIELSWAGGAAVVPVDESRSPQIQ
jgi:uncharacterized BrkB/YihY/UPF0761 family membrane protein